MSSPTMSISKSRSSKRKFVCLLLAQTTILGLFLVIATRAAAQQQFSAQFSALLSAMAANAKQLRHYTFKQRTQVYSKDEVKSSKTDEIRYDSTGEHIIVPLDQQTLQSSERRRFGPGSRLIAHAVEQKREETKDYVERMMSLSGRYIAPDPGKLQAALANADVSLGAATGQLRITLRDFVKHGDVMVMSFDAATNRPTKTEVQSSLDEAPVAIVLVYEQLSDGPSYPGRIVVRADSRQLAVRIFTYDYRR